MKRTIFVLIMIMILVFAMTQTAFASETSLISKSNVEEGKTFSSSWQLTRYLYSGGANYLTFGYDTSFIHEDYAYANSDGWQHRSKVQNDRGSFKGPIKSATDGWSDIEVTHKGSTVYYYNLKVTP